MTGNLRSILAMLAAMGCFSLMDAVLKTLSGSYPPLQVAALRGLTSLPLVCAYVWWRREVHLLLQNAAAAGASPTSAAAAVATAAEAAATGGGCC